MNVPDFLIRGISNTGDISEDNVVLSGAFSFNDNSRDDEYGKELSINWYDDDGALKEAKNKKKINGESQFKAGLAMLDRTKIDYFFKDHIEQNRFNYERAILPENKYHGNLLINKAVKRPIQKIITASLSLCVEKVLPPGQQS